MQQETSCFGCTRRCHEGLAGQKAPARKILFQALTVLLPPFLGFAAVYLLSGLVLSGAGEPERAALGVLGLFVSAFAVWLTKKFGRDRIRLFSCKLFTDFLAGQ